MEEGCNKGPAAPGLRLMKSAPCFPQCPTQFPSSQIEENGIPDSYPCFPATGIQRYPAAEPADSIRRLS